MLSVCSFNREVFCLFSHRTAAEECILPDLVILLSFLFPTWFIDLDFFLTFCPQKDDFFFPLAKLFKMLFCTFLPLTKQTGRFWRLDSVFCPFHLSVCLASGMWLLANNAQPVQTEINLSTANQERISNSNFMHCNFPPPSQTSYIRSSLPCAPMGGQQLWEGGGCGQATKPHCGLSLGPVQLCLLVQCQETALSCTLADGIALPFCVFGNRAT